jgi:hypothetical protein
MENNRFAIEKEMFDMDTQGIRIRARNNSPAAPDNRNSTNLARIQSERHFASRKTGTL